MKQLALALSLVGIAGASGPAPCVGGARGKAPSAPGVFEARKVIAAQKDHIPAH